MNEENSMFRTGLCVVTVGGVALLFGASVAVEAIKGHQPFPHTEAHIPQQPAAVFSTSEITSSGSLFGTGIGSSSGTYFNNITIPKL
ncbi:MAG: hypothetical protein V3T49_02560 [Dehalococcoidia bacterium]